MASMEDKELSNTELAIVEAAQREFMTKGFAGARTTAIAERAGVSHALLHYYFRTKEQLFERIFEQKMRVVEQSVVMAFGDTELSLVERIQKGVEQHFDFVVANPDLPRFVINEIFSHPDLYEVMRQRIATMAGPMVQGLQDEVDREAARGVIERIDVRMMLISVISLNIFAVLAYPVIEPLFGDLTADREAFFARRKEENVALILRRMQKNDC